jgi:hypothetical protein
VIPGAYPCFHARATTSGKRSTPGCQEKIAAVQGDWMKNFKLPQKIRRKLDRAPELSRLSRTPTCFKTKPRCWTTFSYFWKIQKKYRLEPGPPFGVSFRLRRQILRSIHSMHLNLPHPASGNSTSRSS